MPPAPPPTGPHDGGTPPRQVPTAAIVLVGGIASLCILITVILGVAISSLTGGSSDNDEDNVLVVNTAIPFANSQATPTTLPAAQPTATSAPTQVPQPTSVANQPPAAAFTVACPGTSGSYISVGNALVATANGYTLYAEPSISGRVIGPIVTGMVMDVLNGPRCADNGTWWYVRYGITLGWMQENANGQTQAVAVQGVGSLPPITNRIAPPAGATVLTNGIGLSDGSPQNAGEFQVEWYCNILNYGVATDGNNWLCTINGVVLATLSVDDLDRICQATYNNPRAFAIQNGTGDLPAYRWQCYGR